jgi:hypothetical protein
LDLLQRIGIRAFERLTLSLNIAVELVNLGLEVAAFRVELVGGQRRLLALQRIALLA